MLDSLFVIFSSYGLVLKILFVFTLFVGFFRNGKSSSFFFLGVYVGFVVCHFFKLWFSP